MLRSIANLFLISLLAGCGVSIGDSVIRRSADTSSDPAMVEKRSNGDPSEQPGRPNDKSDDPPLIASEPVNITGSNLTFDGARSRCTSSQVEGQSGQFRITCLAVEVVKGVEQVPSKTDNGLSLAWQTPTASAEADLRVDSCVTTSQNLAQNCLIRVKLGSKAVDVTFGLTLSEGTSEKPVRQRTDNDVITLPYGVSTIGYVPEIPVLVSTAADLPAKPASGIGALRQQDEAMLVGKVWVFASQRIPLSEFVLGPDAQAVYCGKSLYFTSFHRLFVVEEDKARHIAGSINGRKLDDISHPLRTHWERIGSLACKGDHVIFETRNPTRIYDLSPKEVISILAKDHLLGDNQPHSSIAVDRRNNVYFLKGKNIGRLAPDGTITEVYNGQLTLESPEILALDELADDTLNGFIVVNRSNSETPKIFSIQPESSSLSLLAGNGKGYTSVGGYISRAQLKGRNARTMPLRGVHSMVMGRDTKGARLILIVEQREDTDSVDDGGALLSLTSDGKASSLSTASANVALKAKDGETPIIGRVFLGVTTNGLTITPDNKVLMKVIFRAEHGNTVNFVTVPLEGGTPTWFGGRLPSRARPTQLAIDPAKILLGQTLSVFATDGTLFLIEKENNNGLIYKQTADGLVRLPVDFDANVVSATIARDSSQGRDRLVYVEGPPTHRIREMWLSGTSKYQPRTLVESPSCDIGDFFGLMCIPETATVDPNSRVVFYDRGYRLIRRLNLDGNYETLAGTMDLAAPSVSPGAGTSHVPTSFRFSMVRTLRYDARGVLHFVEFGGLENNENGDSAVILPSIGKLENGKITVLVGSLGTQGADQFESKNNISAADFKPKNSSNLSLMPDGSMLFSDQDRVLMLRENNVTRIFGGTLANADCGVGTLDRMTAKGSVPTIPNALSRFCAGKIIHITSLNACVAGKTAVAINMDSLGVGRGEVRRDRIVTERFDDISFGRFVLRLDIPCAGIN